MLYLETIDKSTLALLKNILDHPALNDLRLVGGTALALQIGHRKSIDLDLFGVLDFSQLDMVKELSYFGEVTQTLNSPKIKSFFVNDIKVDFVDYHYPWLNEVNGDNGLRLAFLEDIAAMKMEAITNRGSKKDFIDVAFLLEHFSLGEMIQFYHKKFNNHSPFMLLKSLTYFEDAEEQVPPEMLVDVSWEGVKKSILAAHVAYVNGL